MESLAAPPPPPQFDVVSEIRLEVLSEIVRVALQMENALITLAMERTAKRGSCAAPVSADSAAVPVRVAHTVEEGASSPPATT